MEGKIEEWALSSVQCAFEESWGKSDQLSSAETLWKNEIKGASHVFCNGDVCVLLQ